MCSIQGFSFYRRIPVHPLLKPTHVILEFQYLLVSMLHGGWFNFLRGFGGEAVSPVIGDCLIDDCSAVDTFPGIKDKEEVREPFHHHQSFALRTIHNYFLPRYVSELAREGIAICDPARHHRIINNLALWELLIRTTLYTPLYLFFNFVRHFDFGENEDRRRAPQNQRVASREFPNPDSRPLPRHVHQGLETSRCSRPRMHRAVGR